MRYAARICQVGNDEAGHTCQRLDSSRQVLACGLIEVEHNWREIPVAKFLANGVKDGLAFGRKATEDQNGFRSNRVDNFLDPLIIHQEVNELGDRYVVDGYAGLVTRGNDEPFLRGFFKINVPRSNTVDARSIEARLLQVCVNQNGPAYVSLVQ